MKKVGIIKRFFALLLVFLLSINGFAAVVSDNDGSAFITKAEFDSLKNNFQAQIDQYNTSIDSKIDGAIANYLAGIKLSTTDTLATLIKNNYENIRWKYADVYESKEVPFNGQWSCQYWRPSSANSVMPVAGRNLGACTNTAQNNTPQYVDGAISGTSLSGSKMVKLKQSSHASYEGQFSVSGFYLSGGFRDYENLFCLPISAHAWQSFGGSGQLPLPDSPINMLSQYGYSEPIFGFPILDTWRIDWFSGSTTNNGQALMRVTKNSSRVDVNVKNAWLWPGTGDGTSYAACGDDYGYRRIFIYGYDAVTNTVNYAASSGTNTQGFQRTAGLSFTSTTDDIIVGNVKYPPTELIITDTSDPGYVMMGWSSSRAKLSDFLTVKGWGYIVKMTSDAPGTANTWQNIQWNTFPANCEYGVDLLATFYQSGTTNKSGYGFYGQSNYLKVENVWYQQDALPLYQRLYFDVSDMTSSDANLTTYLNSKGIYNGVPMCVVSRNGEVKITMKVKDDLISGSRSQIKLWVTNGPIENNGDLTNTTSGTADYVNNKYTIVGATNADNSIQVNPGTGEATVTIQFNANKDDIVYLHAIPVSNQAGQEVVVNISSIATDINYTD